MACAYHAPRPSNLYHMNHQGWLHPAALKGSGCRDSYLNNVINIFTVKPTTR